MFPNYTVLVVFIVSVDTLAPNQMCRLQIQFKAITKPGLTLHRLNIFTGYFKSVEKFVKNNDGQLEFETQDELHETPLLISARAGIANIETINILIDCGGR